MIRQLVEMLRQVSGTEAIGLTDAEAAEEHTQVRKLLGRLADPWQAEEMMVDFIVRNGHGSQFIDELREVVDGG